MPNLCQSAAGFGGRFTHTSGAFPIGKSLAASAARVRHDSAQNYNCVRRRECILPHKPPTGTARCNHHGQGQKQANGQVHEPTSIFRSVWVNHLVVLQSLTRHKASATKPYSKAQPTARETAISGLTRVGTWRRSSAPPTRFPFCYFSTSYALQQDRLRRSD